MSEAGRGYNREVLWECTCDCGEKIVASGLLLRHGDIRSCGCLSKDLTIKRNKTILVKHGGSYEGNYNRWRGIKTRCHNTKAPQFQNYGGKGVKLFGPWVEDFNAFNAWINENLGIRPPGNSLDRINPYGDYCPGNLRWASSITQGNNRTWTKMSREEYHIWEALKIEESRILIPNAVELLDYIRKED